MRHFAAMTALALVVGSGLGSSAQAARLNYEFEYDLGRLGSGRREGSINLDSLNLDSLNLGSLGTGFLGRILDRGVLDDIFDGGLLGGVFDGGNFDGGILGGIGSEWRHGRFENQFTQIQTAYDGGVQNTPNFYATDDYADLVDDTEQLIQRYDNFVTGVDRSVDRMGDLIDKTNERITRLDDLLVDFQERENLSEARLERIENLITGAQDLLTMKVNFLTETQSTLEERLGNYQAFQTDLTEYLDEIVDAGDQQDASVLAALSSSEASTALAAVAAGHASAVAANSSTAVAAAVPEPTSLAGAAIALAAICGAARRRVG